MTGADDPIDWALHSDGRFLSGYEIDIRSDTPVTPQQPGRLFVRGPAVCLATARGGSFVAHAHGPCGVCQWQGVPG